MATSELKTKVYKELARVSHAVSNPKRLELLDVMAQRVWSVEELSREISMSIASASQHLQILKAARLVETERRGNFIMYRIADDGVLRLLSDVKDIAYRKNAQIERLINDYKKDKKILETLSLDELLQKNRKQKILLLDVRPDEEFDYGHIKGAVSIPLSELKKRMNELPKNKTIVAYCRGPLCVMAGDAVKILKQNKFKAIQLEEGYTEWKLKNVQ